MRLIIFFFVAFVCEKVTGTLYLCNPNATCGCSTSFTLVTRIVGGENAARQSWSWAVSLRSYGEHICGGTILSPSFIITAAHCVENITDLANITILAGSLSLNASSDDSSQIRSIAQLYKHPNYDSSSLANDVALLRMSSPLNMTYRNIKPICLPPGTVPQPPDNISVVVIGWGSTSGSTLTLSSTLLQVTLQTIPSTNSGCGFIISDSALQFCAGVPTGDKDACQGDSGGPLMAFVDNVWQLYGSATIYQCNTNTSCGCSTSLTLISRIIGGESAVRQSWSWAVSIRTSGEHRCGGTILSPSFIITAAHCFEYITDLKSVTILAGSLTLKPSSNNSSQVRSIAKLYRHPRFDPSSNRNDVALLRLSSPFNMRHGNIKSICLPSGTVSQPPDNINMIAIGWGITSISSDKSSSTLRQVTLKSVSLTYSGCKPLIFDSKLQFCAGIITGGKDTCLGDSGGPLMAFVNNIWQLHGITSYGNGCALPEYPGVYTRISYYQTPKNT
ncbi:unnamed protein product [Rotaria sp. Silwood1]|nr:unnamed protein product [Rotaria sp. Silwood1]